MPTSILVHMRWKRGVVGVGALASLALAGGAGAAGAGCAPAGSKVLASSPSAQLYSAAGNVYGCVGSRRRPSGGGARAEPHDVRVEREVLAGRYAGVDLAQMGVDTFQSSVRVVDLASGATVASAPAAAPELRGPKFIQSTVTERWRSTPTGSSRGSRRGAPSAPSNPSMSCTCSMPRCERSSRPGTIALAKPSAEPDDAQAGARDPRALTSRFRWLRLHWTATPAPGERTAARPHPERAGRAAAAPRARV